ncbi:glycosyl transferase family 1, partial [Serratia marcescens]
MIYVNARFLTQDLTGVQRFAQEVCLALSKIRHDIVF